MPRHYVSDLAFQYPLRAYGLSNNVIINYARVIVDKLSVPSTGLWAEQPRRSGALRRCGMGFQYPLRAYGLSNTQLNSLRSPACGLSVPSTGLWAEQHPRQAGGRGRGRLSVPSTGLWAEQHPQPAPHAVLSVLSVPSTGLWAEQPCSHLPLESTSIAFSTLYGPMG